MSIQYPAPGFELTTFWLQVSSLNQKTRAPALGGECVCPHSEDPRSKSDEVYPQFVQQKLFENSQK